MNYRLLYSFNRDEKTITIYLGDDEKIHASTNNETPELVTPGSLGKASLDVQAERMISTGVQRKHAELFLAQHGERA